MLRHYVHSQQAFLYDRVHSNFPQLSTSSKPSVVEDVFISAVFTLICLFLVKLVKPDVALSYPDFPLIVVQMLPFLIHDLD